MLAIICGVFADPIQKCQDEKGNWHYGDFAATECASSEITKLNETGTEIGKESPPPTQAELDQIKHAKQVAESIAKQKLEQQQKDLNLVQIYGSEEAILATRQRKLASIDKNVEVTTQLRSGILADIENLKSRKQNNKVRAFISDRELAIESYDNAIAKSLHERTKLDQKYLDILEEFRTATSRLELDE